MTHNSGLSLSIIIYLEIWKTGPSFLLSWSPKILVAALDIPM